MLLSGADENLEGNTIQEAGSRVRRPGEGRHGSYLKVLGALLYQPVGQGGLARVGPVWPRQSRGEDDEKPHRCKGPAILPHALRLAISPRLMTEVYLTEPDCL